MKKSLLVLGLIAMLLAGGLVLASCRAGCEGAGTCDVKPDGNSFKGSVCSNESCAVYKSIVSRSDGKCDC